MMHSRPILLAFIDGLPFIFWAYSLLILTDLRSLFRLQSWWGAGVIAYLVWHCYFFVMMEGRGPFHDVIHGVAVLAVCHVIYLCISQWRDDLVTARRRIRAVFLIAASAILSMYAASEISGFTFMRSAWGSLVGASLFLLLSTMIGIFCLSDLSTDKQDILLKSKSKRQLKSKGVVPEQYQELYQQLSSFMDDKGYTESRLTLSRLAEHLGTQEHRLRALINQGLGYRNFSNYLNDHRLPLGCEWLLEQPVLPVTEIAYRLGYGSITSFNRAFKVTYGQAPSDYRNQYLVDK
jgi:AraC-like DNA-binding protein